MTTVLVVDDIELNTKLLEAKLLNEYYTVFVANSGEKALEILRRNVIDVILLDIMMPKMDGFELCTIIKKDKNLMHIPVVMVTALSDNEDRLRALEVGADEFLTKPVYDVSLFARMKSLARIRSSIDELILRNQINTELGHDVFEISDDHLKNSKILIIDDDKTEVKRLKLILSNITTNISYLSSKSDNFLSEGTPDMVIISSQIESTDPLRIVASLRNKKEFRYVSIMLIIVEDEINLLLKGFEIGVNDYFDSSLDYGELIARTRAQIKRKIYQDELRSGLEEKINLSTKDSLTKLFNRRYFDSYMIQLVNKINDPKNQEPLSLNLMILDLDNFKHVNDSYGHQTGDITLVEISNILMSKLRATDILVRYGGEEFAVILKGISINECNSIAEKIRVAISNTSFFINSKLSINITVSLGIGEYKRNEQITDFIERVDKALYSAKFSGKNKIIQG